MDLFFMGFTTELPTTTFMTKKFTSKFTKVTRRFTRDAPHIKMELQYGDCWGHRREVIWLTIPSTPAMIEWPTWWFCWWITCGIMIMIMTEDHVEEDKRWCHSLWLLHLWCILEEGGNHRLLPATQRGRSTWAAPLLPPSSSTSSSSSSSTLSSSSSSTSSHHDHYDRHHLHHQHHHLFTLFPPPLEPNHLMPRLPGRLSPEPKTW